MQTKNLNLPLLFRRKLVTWPDLFNPLARLGWTNLTSAVSDAFKDCQKNAH